VPRPSPDDELTNYRQVVLIIRLVLDRHAQLRHGELLDAAATSQGRFVTLTEMGEAVSRWLRAQRANEPSNLVN
jgi:hypothetical protein